MTQVTIAISNLRQMKISHQHDGSDHIGPMGGAMANIGMMARDICLTQLTTVMSDLQQMKISHQHDGSDHIGLWVEQWQILA
jgi:hypothetical protein